MARRKFAKLKALMFEREITQADIARVLGRGTTYVTRRMNALEPFTLDDVRQICEMLHIERALWLDYFIEDGGAA